MNLLAAHLPRICPTMTGLVGRRHYLQLTKAQPLLLARSDGLCDVGNSIAKSPPASLNLKLDIGTLLASIQRALNIHFSYSVVQVLRSHHAPPSHDWHVDATWGDLHCGIRR
jgi:hypothetical protein